MPRLLLSLKTLLWGANLARASLVCDIIANTSAVRVERPASLAWISEQANYWSTACSSLTPACILYPKSPDEVASIVTVLRTASTENFAIKSGGHNPNQYFASIDDRAVISTASLNGITLDVDAATVRVGPGNRWDDVAAALDGTHRTVVGGRLGNVGVGGYLLGGGLSFLSAEYGWAADSILAFELVLANSSVVNVTKETYPDLFVTLRGGGNEFGIVTAFTLQTYPQDQIWGGSITYKGDNTTSEALLVAINDFLLNNDDNKAAIIPTAEMAADELLTIWIIYFFYDGPEPPDGVFDEFLGISYIVNTCATQSFASLLRANDAGVVKGSVIGLGTETAPLPEGGVPGVGKRDDVSLTLLRSYYKHWKDTTASIWEIGGAFSEISFNPLPKAIGQKSLEKGGDLLALDFSADRILFEFTLGYIGLNETSAMVTAMETMYSGIRELVLGYIQDGRLPQTYLPLFYNVAYHTQDVAGRLKPGMADMARSVRSQVDPDGLWRDRTGGFKF
ncbi:FAD binding domain-containing protein [Thozetella sp. PMI_491]|nr:FAD binding domain-containing protein [Thozetella sp. PMI_491]